MKRLLALVALVVAPLVAVTAAYAADAIIGCQQSHFNNDDMIVFPGQPGASHRHQYAGARSNNAFSTVQSMVASGSTCSDPRDTSGIWAPSWNAGYPLHPNRGVLLYYTFNGTHFPAGFKVIVRWESGHILFKCGPGSNPESRTPPTRCTSGMFVPVVELPRFYDGRLDSPDHISHTCYSRSGACSIPLPKLKVYWRLAVPPGANIDTNVSSGNYQSFHLDYVGTGAF